MGGGGWSARAASSGGELQTARRGFFVLHGSCVFLLNDRRM